MLFFRQTWTLVKKNIILILFRRPLTTPLRCFFLPVIFILFLAYARNLFIPPSKFGIGDPSPVRSLGNALRAATGGRDRVIFVNNEHTGGDIEKVINLVADSVRSEGRVVEILSTEEQLLSACRNTLRGNSRCYGAAVFYASPSEGLGNMWNYSLRADGGLGIKILVKSEANDVQIYPLPLQHAIDFAIASTNQTIEQSALPSQVNEFPFTDKNQKERDDNLRTRFMGAIVDILAVAYFLSIIGVTYQLVGLMASERELGMSQILDASMPNKRRWEPQAARLLASHIAFDIMFFPGWLFVGLILGVGIFTKTNIAILIVFNILIGLSMTSFSIFGGAFFRKAQLSGILNVIASLLLGVLAQSMKPGTGAVAILGLLFPSMNYTFFTVLMARWERESLPTNLLKAAPNSTHSLPGIAFFVFALIQIFVYPFLGALLETRLYGTKSKGRKLISPDNDSRIAVELTSFTKRYTPSWWARNVARRLGKIKETVVAVDHLDLKIPRGQIMVLLGANGSGKSTTLEAISGLNTITEGSISVDGEGGLGICPQRNVLWDDLTTLEHVRIFNRLKSSGKPSSEGELKSLIAACDLDRKLGAKSRSLSGGQKRKLQLSMMFTGGSRVCCIDECSSGVDALARQKLWNILLQERGARTIIFTTHFLDEADLLSDQIAILSKGCLKANGSAVELKNRSGNGYRVHVPKDHGHPQINIEDEGIPKKILYDQTIYTLQDSAQAANFVRVLETNGISNYEITSPTIEEIFFNVAEETEAIEASRTQSRTQRPSTGRPSSRISSREGILETEEKSPGMNDESEGLQLQKGRRISAFRQAFTLFRKRWTVAQRNYLPYVAALALPVIAAGLVTLFLKNYKMTGCSITDQFDDLDFDPSDYATEIKDVVVGPLSRLPENALDRIGATLFSPGGDARTNEDGGSLLQQLRDAVDIVDGNIDDFNRQIQQNYKNVTPGGFFLGDSNTPPTFAYRANADIQEATFVQNALDTLITNISISTTYRSFDIPFPGSAGKSLQLVTYFGLAMAVYPAFLALYPTFERLRSIRQLQYSNGVRSISLWSAYITFDFIIVLTVSVVSVVIYRAASSEWYHIEYLFVVFFCYGLASTLLSYVISLAARSQLAAFAFAAGGQAVMFLLYFIAYMSTLTYAPPTKIDSQVNIVHFTIALISPMANLTRALFVSLNVFNLVCRDRSIASYPGEMTLYGGPILYLILQSAFLFGILLWCDSGFSFARFRRKTYKSQDAEEVDALEDEIAAEVRRVNASPDDGLRALHLTKAFGRNVAVEDVTFGVKRGEVFALLGPNGAGKSTTISLIRGDIRPSDGRGEVFVENIPISTRRATARNSLGVCPQIDACDQMTVVEHLRFYARVRGVVDVDHNTRKVIHAVGLDTLANRMAAKLSGGNKRKLSLAIALMGNPSVLLLDEPSSGMDVCAKRVMWRTLASVVPGRSLVLTTHSMEEADALADRAGIMGRKMLALGTSDYLRRKHGDRYHVHLITTTAPHTPLEEMERIKDWISTNLDGAIIEQRTYHGQLRFSVPAHSQPTTTTKSEESITEIYPIGGTLVHSRNGSGIGALFTMLESHKQALGFQYYSVSPTTLDQVFLTIVRKHNIEEENSREEEGEGSRGGFWRRLTRRRKGEQGVQAGYGGGVGLASGVVVLGGLG